MCAADDPGVRGRLNECLETILNKAQEPPKSKKVQHSNAKNAVLMEAISLIIHSDRSVDWAQTGRITARLVRAVTRYQVSAALAQFFFYYYSLLYFKRH